MSKRKSNIEALEKDIDTFRKRGPFNWDTIWALVQRCADSDEFVLCDAVNARLADCAEVKKMLTVKDHLSPSQLEIWNRGFGGPIVPDDFVSLDHWTAKKLAKYGDFEKIMERFPVVELTDHERFMMVKIIQHHARETQEATKQARNAKRDRSPKRS